MNDDAKLALGAFVVLGLYYYYRVENVKKLKAASAAKSLTKNTPQMQQSSKFPFVSAKERIYDPSVWKINEPGWEREGQYGLKRRDYIDPVAGTQIVTHTDAWVNV